MTGAAWRVLATDAEAIRRELRAGGWLADDRAVEHRGEFVLFPLRSAPDPTPSAGLLVDADLPARDRPPRSYRDLLDLPPGQLDALPRSFDIVGDIVVVRIPPDLRPDAAAIGAALLRFVPGARIVAQDNGVHGTERRRSLVAIAGSGGFRTRHRENGIDIEVDLAKAYFSPRLAREHARVAAQVRTGESLFDLFCGVGPFSLAVAHAGRASRIVAVDSNASAIDLLQASAARAGGSPGIDARVADVTEFLPSAGVADRVVMNLPHGGIKYVAQVASSVASGGALHYYEVTERTDVAGRPAALAELLAPAGRFAVDPPRVVHPYAPTSDLYAYTAIRRE